MTAVNVLCEDLESRLPALLAKFPEQTEDSLRLLATYDPTDAKYLTWILTRLRREGGGITPEAGEALRRHLERFEIIKRLPDFTGSPDINQYGTFEDFYRQMETSSTLMTKGEQEKSYRKLATYRDYTLCQIMTEAAAKKFAQNTGLCFVGDFYAHRYVVQEPPLYGVFQAKQPVAALHPGSGQYHDMNNRQLKGQLRRAVLYLAKRSGAPLLEAWYQMQLEALRKELRQARLERHRARRKASVRPERFVNGVVNLGEHGGYQMFAMLPTHGKVMALLPEERRAAREPVLTLADAEGNVVALIDPSGGVALNAQGQQLDLPLARTARSAFSGYIDDMGASWVRDVANNPNVYKRSFDDIIHNIHDRFIDERINGYTDPRSGKYIPPVDQKQALQRWVAFKPRMQKALLTGLSKLRLPSIGMARVLGYQGDVVDLLGEALPFTASDSSVYILLKEMKSTAIVAKLLEAVDPAFAKAMEQASAEIFADEGTQMYGGGRPDKRRAVDAYDINCGLCEEWAERVRALYQEATGTDAVDVLDPGNLSGNADDSLEAGHVFVRFNGVFYDAETPNGVSDWKQLPMFVKQREDEPSENLERFAAAIGKEYEGKEKITLWKFKRAVRGYIKWAHTDEEQGRLYDDADLKALAKAKTTFAEAEAILAKYESEPSFLYMVRSGYFV